MAHNQRLPIHEAPPSRPRTVRLWHHPDIHIIHPNHNAFSPPWREAEVAFRLCNTCEQLDLENLGYLPRHSRTPTSSAGVRIGGGLGWIRSSKDACDLCLTIWRSLSTTMRDAAEEGDLGHAEVYLRAHRDIYGPGGSGVVIPADPDRATRESIEPGPLCRLNVFVLPHGAANDPRSAGSDAPRSDGWLWVYLREREPRIAPSRELGGLDEEVQATNENNSVPPEDLANVVPGRALASPYADETMSTIHDWLRLCLQDHHDCDKFVFGSVKHFKSPPRLIEISANGTVARLVEASELDVPYLALSYCWGVQKVLATTSNNYHSFQDSLPTLQLPKTIREAIEITYRIGYRHLWVDSICIMQDSMEDWRKHTVLMGYIYANAVLTIAATSAAGGSEGCFLPRPRATRESQSLYNHEVQVPCVLSGRYLGPMLLAPGDDSWSPWSGSLVKELKNSSWKDRAWVLQERFFSRRIVHFGASQTHWECRRCVKSQMFPSYKLFQDSIELDWQTLRDPDSGDVPDIDAAEQWWGKVMARYTRTKITYPADRLPALAAIIQEAEEVFGIRYVAGLCVETLPRSLLWMPRANQESEPERPHWVGDFEHMPDFIYVLAVPSAVDRTQGAFHQRLTAGSRRPLDPPPASSWSWAHWEGPVMPFVARGYFRSHLDNVCVHKRGDIQSHHQSVLTFSTRIRKVAICAQQMSLEDASDVFIKRFDWIFSPHKDGLTWLYGIARHAVVGPDEFSEFVILDDATTVPKSLCLASVGTCVLTSFGFLYRIQLSLAIEPATEPQVMANDDFPSQSYYRRRGVALAISEMPLQTFERKERPRTIRHLVTGAKFRFAFGSPGFTSTGTTIALV
ncbi:hypothetical protein RB597_010194 [Gaeumannomyces tritici]